MMVILLLKQRVFQENVLQYCLGVLGTGNSSMSPLGRTNLHPKLPSFPALFQRNRLPSVLANRQRGTWRRDVIRAINPRCSLPDDGIGERDRRNIQGNHFGDLSFFHLLLPNECRRRCIGSCTTTRQAGACKKGWAEKWAPCCENFSGRSVKQHQEQNSPNLGSNF